MRRPDGYATILDPDAPLIERDTAQCAHCGCIITTKPGTLSTVYLISTITPTGLIVTEEVPGAGCWHCDAPVCLACHALGTCLPLERRLAQLERTPAWR